MTLNSRRELLVVSERYHRSDGRPPRYKLPGGALQEGEHLVEGVMREVQEETGVETEFDALVCFRHWHGYRYGKSDIYFVCRLHPVSEEISIQEEEIAESLWMPVADYLGDGNVHPFNKRIVRAAMESPGISPAEIEGVRRPRQVRVLHARQFKRPASVIGPRPSSAGGAEASAALSASLPPPAPPAAALVPLSAGTMAAPTGGRASPAPPG